MSCTCPFLDSPYLNKWMVIALSEIKVIVLLKGLCVSQGVANCSFGRTASETMLYAIVLANACRIVFGYSNGK